MENEIAASDKKSFLQKPLFKKIAVFTTAIVLLAILCFCFKDRILPVQPFFSSPYRLVPEKISRSAAIAIDLPLQTDPLEAKGKISFDPPLEGEWIGEENPSLGKWLDGFIGRAWGAQESELSRISFKPRDPLRVGYYYGVSFDTGEGGVLKADFLAVEDPKIEAVFPASDFEAPEDSKITVIFNRPMVPLTSLQELESKDVFVDIEPKTEGRFKWISTNTLQFIPKERLKRSSNYTVRVGGEFVSLDGLAVAGGEFRFKTRSLRYKTQEGCVPGSEECRSSVVYNEPYRIYFNQPVDLKKTVQEIMLEDSAEKVSVPFTAQYKKEEKEEQNKFFSQNEESAGSLAGRLKDVVKAFIGQENGIFESSGGDVDKSVVEIFLKQDKFGRSKIWDLEKDYTLSLKKAYPEEGDITLNKEQSFYFKSSGLVASFAAEGRTSYADAELFDPEGKLIIKFYEPIDLKNSSISSIIGIENIEYGEKCNDENFSLQDINCQKIPDEKILKISFDKNQLSAGQEFSVVLEKIYNTKKEKINPKEISREISVYKPLEYRLGSVSLDSLTICSDNPLVIPEKEDFKQFIRANLDFEIFSWNESVLIRSENTNNLCRQGEFQTSIRAGLMPESDYRFEFSLSDVFGQRGDQSFGARTGAMEKQFVTISPMQRTYSVAASGKHKISFATKNITYAETAVCRLSSYALYSLYLNRGYANSIDYSQCQTVVNKRVALPQRYWINNYFDIDVKDYFSEEKGNYMILVTHPQYRDSQNRQLYQRVYLTVTDLAVAEKKINPITANNYSYQEPLKQDQLSELKNLYWVTDVKSQNPISGAQVSLYSRGLVVAKALTDSQGIALIEPLPGVEAAVVEYQGDSTFVAGYESRLGWGGNAANAKKVYIYTDKPLYRPQDEVRAKGILRLGFDGNYQMLDSRDIELELFNPRYEKILTQKATLSEYGTFDTSFTLDASSPLGSYRICLKGSYNCGYFDILEYVPASFKVEAKSDKEEYVSKDAARIDVDAQYYFGVPVAGAEAEYTLSSQNYFFDKYRGNEYLNFGFYDEECYDRWCYGDRFISRGKIVLDSEGRGTISETIDLEKIYKDVGYATSRVVVFDITVKNSMGQSVSTQKSFIVHAGEFYLGIKADPSFIEKNQQFSLKVKALDLEGKEKNIGNIEGEVYKTEWINAKRLEAGGQYVYHWEKKRDFVRKAEFSNMGDGNYQAKLSLEKEGQYEIDVFAFDKRQNKVLSREYVYVHGPGIVSVRPSDGNYLTLKAKKKDLAVGEEGEIIIESPYSKAKALIALERGSIFDYQIADVEGGLYDFKFEAKEEYAPNLFVSVLLQSSDPAVKFGSQEFTIDSQKNKIFVEMASDKKSYQPGEEVRLKITSRDRNGNPLQAELSLAVVDLSVLALKGNPKKDPFVFFYGGFPLTVSTSSNIASILEVQEEKADSKGGSGGGGEGDEIRGEFKETAYWKGDIITNSAGEAEIVFKLPDNLTTWQAEALAVTRDTKLGAGYIEFMAKKDLMVVPLKPRFIIPGDEFYLGAQIFNQSEKTQSLAVSFNSETLEFLDKKKDAKIKLKSKESKTVYFQVKAPLLINKGNHYFTFKAQGEGIEDAVRLAIPVNPNLSWEATATSNYTTADRAVEIIYLPQNVLPEPGTLTIKSSATLAVFLSDSLNYLLAYPYGCTEQVSSRLAALAAVRSGLGIENLQDKLKLEKVRRGEREYSLDELISLGLAKIYANQRYDGGFGVWNGGETNFYATLEAVKAMSALKNSGVKINEDSLKRGISYLFKELNDRSKTWPNGQLIAAANVLLPLEKEGFASQSSLLKLSIMNIVRNDKTLADDLSNKSLLQLSLVLNSLPEAQSYKGKIDALLDNLVTIDSRGAFLQANSGNIYHDYYETTIADTALYLESLAAAKRETPINDKIVRWLLNSRGKDGSWGSTQNTLESVKAFTAYLAWRKETAADYDLDIRLNQENIAAYSFGPDTILDQIKKEIPVKELKKETYNPIEFSKDQKNPLSKDALYYDLSLKYYLEGATPPRDEGFSVTRSYFALEDEKGEKPLSNAKPGDVIRVRLEINTPRDRRFVALEDFIPAGLEIVDMNLATEQKSLRLIEPEVQERGFYPEFKEIRDDRAFAYRSYLKAGTYQFDYYARVLVKGKYFQPPASASEMYNPENFGRTASGYFEVQ